MSLDNKVVDLADLKVSHDYLLEQDGLLSDRIDELGSGIDGVESIIGDLSNLSTTLKDSIVSAINEVLQTGGRVKSVNSKTGDVVLKTSDLTNDSGYLTSYTETDPTVPSWAKQNSKPTYTAQEVGASSVEDMNSEVNTRRAADAQLQSQITALGNGAPIPVETVAEMIDNTKAYLYTGAEVGWLTGYWYTYDSAQAKFVPRGEYGVGTVIDNTLTVSGDAADAKATGDAISEVNGRLDNLDQLTEIHEPHNYGNANTENLVIATSGLVGKITATDNADGGVEIVNSAGTNGIIAFELSALPYKVSKKLKFAVSIQNYKGTPALDLRRAVSQGAIGAVISTLTVDEQTGEYVYVWDNFQNYNYDVLGNIFLGYSLRYNQTTPVIITLAVSEVGDVEKTIISPDAIEDIGYDNLSDAFKASLSVVSGDKPTLYGGKQISVFNKGVAIGDSLTAGVFNRNNGGSMAYSTIAAHSYPAKLKQLCGIDMINLGNGGYTSDQWWTAHGNDDLSGYQFAIIQLGVNDALQYSGWTQTSITAFTNIINKLLTENNGIFVFVATIIPATAYMSSAMDAVSQGIRDLVESINNDHVFLLDMAAYGNTAEEVGYNNGHLSALGYERLALDYISYISYAIAQNPVLFRNVQFIGTDYRYD